MSTTLDEESGTFQLTACYAACDKCLQVGRAVQFTSVRGGRFHYVTLCLSHLTEAHDKAIGFYK